MSDWKSDNLDKLGEALAKARAEFDGIKKNRQAEIKTKSGSSYTYRYADMAAVMEACEPALSAQGLSVIQLVEGEAGSAVTIRTVLLHSSGQWTQSVISMPISADKLAGSQAVGSAITFGRRYAYLAIVGVAPDDDDGKAASQRSAPQRHTVPASQIRLRREAEASVSLDKGDGETHSYPADDDKAPSYTLEGAIKMIGGATTVGELKGAAQRLKMASWLDDETSAIRSHIRMREAELRHLASPQPTEATK